MIGISKHCPESGKAPQHLQEPWLLLLHEHQVQIHLRSCPRASTKQKLANDLKGVLMCTELSWFALKYKSKTPNFNVLQIIPLFNSVAIFFSFSSTHWLCSLSSKSNDAS